jgi:hypothetical protein
MGAPGYSVRLTLRPFEQLRIESHACRVLTSVVGNPFRRDRRHARVRSRREAGQDGRDGSDPKWRESSQASDEAQCQMRLRRRGPSRIDPRPDIERYGTYPECDDDSRLQIGSDSPLLLVYWSIPFSSHRRCTQRLRRVGEVLSFPRLLAPRSTTFRADAPPTSPLVWSSRVWEALPHQTTLHPVQAEFSPPELDPAKSRPRPRSNTTRGAKTDPCSGFARPQRRE